MRSMQQSTLGAWLVCAALGSATCAPALAQAPSGAQGLLDNPWVVDVGAFLFGWQLGASLNGQSSSNPEVDFDEVFGRGEDASRVRADVLWRITPAHHLRFMVFSNSVANSRILDEDIHWGDYTFKAGARTDFEHRMQVTALAYEYAFVRRPSVEVAASLGLHYLDIDMSLSGAASGVDSNGNPIATASITQSRSLPAPLPMVGLSAGWVVAPDWYLDARGQLFQAKVDGYDGFWSDVRVGATWMFHRHFGIGLGYNRFYARLDVARGDFNGNLKLGYSGLQAYLTGTF